MANIGFTAHKFIVIDAMRAQDLHTAKRIHETIQDSLIQKARESTCRYVKCDSPNDLIQELDQVFEDCANTSEIPFLHIEGHGEKEFLRLPYGLLKWENIFETIRKINIATRNNLFMTCGACESSYAYRAADIMRECPVFGLLAPDRVVEAGEVEDGFIEFYRSLILENDLNSALEWFISKTNSRNFALVFSQTFFEQSATSYLTQHCTGSGRRRKQEELISIAKQNTNLPLQAVRKEIKRKLRKSQALHLRKFYEKFMMIDKFPENAERFDFDVNEFERNVRNMR